MRFELARQAMQRGARRDAPEDGGRSGKGFAAFCFVAGVAVAFCLIACLAHYLESTDRAEVAEVGAAAGNASPASGVLDAGRAAVDADTSVPPAESSDASVPTASSAPTVNPDGIPIAESMPYIGMPEGLIGDTWLGTPDQVDDPVAGGGLLAGSVPYRWCAENGTGDVVFTAYVRDGEVVKVSKELEGTTYWRTPGSAVSSYYPDLAASGEAVEKKTPGLPEDPMDYSSPNEYADNAQGWFLANGSEDPWYDAYRYWEDNAL